MVADIEQTEELLKCSNTVVIGDFNANPYDEELLSKYAFNAVLFKSIIDKNELTNPNSLKKKDFIIRFCIIYLRITRCMEAFIMKRNI